jgi:hypothetical protein
MNAPENRPTELLAEIRRRRGELRHGMGVLEQALGAPASGDPDRWAQRVGAALVGLDAGFSAHIEVTEGDHGLYEQVLADAPRLAGRVRRLTEEHRVVGGTIADLLEWTDKPADAGTPTVIRDAATELLGWLSRHRQTGADLLFEAYQSDIGGET